MLKKLYYFIMLISILFIFSGCAQFFTFNLFDGLDYVAVPTAEKLAEKPPAEGVAYLKEQMASDSFMQAVEKKPESVTEINTYLESIYNDTTVEEETRISAAVLAADLNLGVTGGDEFVGNVFNAFIELQNLNSGGGTGTGTDLQAVQDILYSIVPDSIAAETDPVKQEAAFIELIEGILTAGEIYQTLGDTIITDPTQGAAVYGDITGGVVMNALVTGLITEVVNTFFLEGYRDPAVAASLLLNLYHSAQNNTEPVLTGIDTSANFDNALSNLLYLQDIALASGADISSLLGGTPPVAP